MIVVATIVAGAIGAVLRYLVALTLAKRGALPWAVLAVNVVGCGIGGMALGLEGAGLISSALSVVLLAGMAGGLTTFSTFSVESIQLVLEGEWRTMAASVSLNLVLGLAAAAAVWALVMSLTH